MMLSKLQKFARNIKCRWVSVIHCTRLRLVILNNMNLIVAFGAGSSVEGHISTPYSGLTIDFGNMDKVVAFHPDE